VAAGPSCWLRPTRNLSTRAPHGDASCVQTGQRNRIDGHWPEIERPWAGAVTPSRCHAATGPPVPHLNSVERVLIVLLHCPMSWYTCPHSSYPASHPSHRPRKLQSLHPFLRSFPQQFPPRQSPPAHCGQHTVSTRPACGQHVVSMWSARARALATQNTHTHTHKMVISLPIFWLCPQSDAVFTGNPCPMPRARGTECTHAGHKTPHV